MPSQILVVGAGPAGMMAAIAAAAAGARVTILEKNDRPGRKMALTGGGRCNFTHDSEPRAMVEAIAGNGKFLYSALHSFTSRDCREFFRRLGIPSVVEDEGRVFPRGADARQMVAALAERARQLGVRFRFGCPVGELLLPADLSRVLGVRLAGGQALTGRVILTTGGMSYPATGSTGDGYRLAAQAGHRIVPPIPAAVPLVCADTWIRQRLVQGVSLPGIALTVLDPDRRLLTGSRGDLLFTHRGISGPAALRASRAVSVYLHRRPATSVPGSLPAFVDLFPDITLEQLLAVLGEQARQNPRKSLLNIVRQMVPHALAPVVLERGGLPAERQVAQISKTAWQTLARLLKNLPLNITGTHPLAEATVTAGGVDVRQIDPRTMASRLVQDLYFAGEVMDVDGPTGGYNLHIAFATGRLAGAAAARAGAERES
ncbi:MAG: NAD(P)/FAD-dependent oxidoreductase [Desulfurispora sp.]|uniref:NAD(P)/FAD-dependent oxidoreductase n=1 Tax=Desulfurispora sp. TaxID=3014275 RepID=UPI00404B5324